MIGDNVGSHETFGCGFNGQVNLDMVTKLNKPSPVKVGSIKLRLQFRFNFDFSQTNPTQDTVFFFYIVCFDQNIFHRVNLTNTSSWSQFCRPKFLLIV